MIRGPLYLPRRGRKSRRWKRREFYYKILFASSMKVRNKDDSIKNVLTLDENCNKADVEDKMPGYVKCTAPSPFRRRRRRMR
jgi:hypothetical protein